MSKKLLAAVFAAAFLATGGVASAADDYVYGADSSAWLTVGSPTPLGVPGATVNIAAGGDVGIYSQSSGSTAGTPDALASVVTINGNGKLTVGKNANTVITTLTAIDLTLAGINLKDATGTLEIATTNGKLTTTGNSEIAGIVKNDNVLNFGDGVSTTSTVTIKDTATFTGSSEINLNQILVNEKTGLDLSTFTFDTAGKIDNTGKTFAGASVTTSGLVGNTQLDKELAALVTGGAGNIGAVTITGDISASANSANLGHLNTASAGILDGTVEFSTALATKAVVNVGGADADLTATSATYAADIMAENILIGNVNEAMTLTGDLTTGAEGALIIKDGDASASGAARLATVTLNSGDVSGIANVIVGVDNTDGKFSVLKFGQATDLSAADIANKGTIEIGTQLVTIGNYSGAGVINNSAAAAGIAQGVQMDAANENFADNFDAVAASLLAYDSGTDGADNALGNVILDGQVAANIDVTSKTIASGNVTLKEVQTTARDYKLGKTVNLTVANNAGALTASQLGAITAGTTNITTLADITDEADTALTINANTTITENGSLKEGAANDITFGGNHTLTNEGTINLTGATTPPTPADVQKIDFAGTSGTVVNTGTINIGSTNTIDNATNGSIDNFAGVAGSVGMGTVAIKGDSAALPTLAGLLVKNNDNDGVKNVGFVNIDGTLTNDFNAVAKAGLVTLTNQNQANLAAKKDVNVGDADVAFAGDNNRFYGDVAGGDISVVGNSGTYFGAFAATNDYYVDGDNNTINGAIGAANDVIVEGKGNTFGPLATVTAANDVDVDGINNTFNAVVEATAGSVNVNATGNSFLGGITAQNGTTTLKKGITATFGGVIDTDVVAQNGSTFAVGNPDADIAGSLDAEAGSTIAFNGDGQIINTSGGSIDVTSGTKLTVDRNLRNTTKELFDDNAVNSLLLDDQFDTSTDEGILAIQNYLDNQNYTTFGDSGRYVLESDGTITYTQATASTDEELDENWRQVLANQGMTDYAGMISGQSYASQLFYAQMSEADFDLLTGEDRFLAEIIKSAAGDNRFYDVNGRPQEAYALEQWKNGADWSGAIEAVTDTVRNFNRAITNRAYNIGHLLNAVEYDECGNVINSCGGFKNRLWAGYTGQWDKNDGRSWDKGYKYDAHGFNIGYDRVTSSGVAMGAAFGYSKGDYKNRGALYRDEKSKIDNYSFGLFASYNHHSGFFTTLSGTYTYSRYKMNNTFADYRSEGFRGYDYGKFHGDSWSVGGKLGYDFSPVQNLTITPTLGLYYYSTRTNRFDTTYRNGMKYSRHTLEMPIDVTVKYDIAVGCDSTLSLLATGGYAYNFHNKGTKVSGFNMGNDFNNVYGDYRTTKPGRSAWNVGGGAQFRYKNVDFGVHYEYYGRKDFKSHSLNANVGYSF